MLAVQDGEGQDAKEFLGLYLAALDEELLPRLASTSDDKSVDHSINSPISRIFRGTFCSMMDAPNRLDSVTVEDWRSLQLDIQVVPFPFPLPFIFD
jgi:ubiquitin carboxyl-terminal hydrolase 10